MPLKVFSLVDGHLFFIYILSPPVPLPHSLPELPGVSLGRPGPLCPASDLHEQVCQLVWHHAAGPLTDEAGPSPL